MKTVNELNKKKTPVVAIDDSLEKFKDKTLFPEKLDKVNQILKRAKLPKSKKANN